MGLKIAAQLAVSPGVQIVSAVDLATGGEEAASLGQRLGRSDLDIPVTQRLGSVPEGGGVLVQATVSRISDAAAQIYEAIDHGWSVVSTCEQLVFPMDDDGDIVAGLDEAARDKGVAVIASGINPGFLMDALPLVLSTACTTVAKVHVTRKVDTNQRRIPLQQKAGVGLTVAEFGARREARTLGHVGLRQSAEMLATGFGWKLTDYRETLEPVIAQAPTETGVGHVGVGGVLGQRQLVEAYEDDRLVVSFDLEMSAGAPARDAIELTGSPTIKQEIEGGVNGDVGTVAVVCNLVPIIATSPPGFHTMADVLPLRVVPAPR
jgi:4-hydroxy-tetrahydrodipicolinate reductase